MGRASISLWRAGLWQNSMLHDLNASTIPSTAQTGQGIWKEMTTTERSSLHPCLYPHIDPYCLLIGNNHPSKTKGHLGTICVEATPYRKKNTLLSSNKCPLHTERQQISPKGMRKGRPGAGARAPPHAPPANWHKRSKGRGSKQG